MCFEKIYKCCTDKKKHVHQSECGGAFYFLGFIGALIYYWSISATFWEGFVGFFKALVWPAFLVFELLIFLGA